MIPNIVLNLLNRRFPGLKGIQNVHTPDEMAQYLLNTGVVNQNDVNQARQKWCDPQVQQQISSLKF